MLDNEPVDAISNWGGWGRLHFRPRHHLVTPRTVSFMGGVNPRVIDDAIWLKLVWAILNFTRADLLCEIHYPLAPCRAPHGLQALDGRTAR